MTASVASNFTGRMSAGFTLRFAGFAAGFAAFAAGFALAAAFAGAFAGLAALEGFVALEGFAGFEFLGMRRACRQKPRVLSSVQALSAQEFARISAHFPSGEAREPWKIAPRAT